MSLSDEELEIYKIAMEGIRQNETKRQNAHSIYTAILVGIATVAAALEKPNYIVMTLVVLVASCLWFLTIRYHRDLADAKWESVSCYQKKLDHSPFDVEWQQYKSKNRKIDLTTIEQIVPILIFLVAFFLLDILHLTIFLN